MPNAALRLYDAPDHPNVSSGAMSSAKPRWDAVQRELWWAGRVVKSYRHVAFNQCAVLAAFEAAGWPRRIDDSLCYGVKKDHKRRRHATIQSLNRELRHTTLRFRADGTGHGIRWEQEP